MFRELELRVLQKVVKGKNHTVSTYMTIINCCKRLIIKCKGSAFPARTRTKVKRPSQRTVPRTSIVSMSPWRRHSTYIWCNISPPGTSNIYEARIKVSSPTTMMSKTVKQKIRANMEGTCLITMPTKDFIAFQKGTGFEGKDNRAEKQPPKQQ